ncbi:hypothetical protein LCGC14_0476590 [marine sediment metagenome]|uniref:Uncharacterized protein n=1 Tax=marine sediment metagenome TaxID=412755 RepID=A0A0F9UXN1_9ZZZZ|nr:hypothetical protein [bacterium]
MTLTDGLIVLSVFAIFGYIIYVKLQSRNSPLTQKTREWFQKTKEKKERYSDTGKWQQTYNEKRNIM